MTFVTDSFTDTSGLALASHVGETGATWTKHGSFATGSAVISDANRMHFVTTSTTCYYASGTPASAEYDVTADILVKSNTGRVGVVARCDTAADTMYVARYDFNNTRWELLKVVAGASTSLGASTQTPTVAQTYALKLEVRDAAKKLFVDGVELISSADNAITAAGKAGIRGNTGTDATGYHLDNLAATDPVAPPSGPPAGSLMLLGVGR